MTVGITHPDAARDARSARIARPSAAAWARSAQAMRISGRTQPGRPATPGAKFLAGGQGFRQQAPSRSARLGRWSGGAALRRAGIPSVDMDVVDEEGGRVRRLVDRPAAAERKVNERVQRAV
jgi:hypothetical protein